MWISFLLSVFALAGGVGNLDNVMKSQPVNVRVAERNYGHLELLSCAYNASTKRVTMRIRNEADEIFYGNLPFMLGNPGVAIPPDTVGYDEGTFGIIRLDRGEEKALTSTPSEGRYMDAPLDSRGRREPPSLLMVPRPDLCENVVFASIYNGAVWQYVSRPCGKVTLEDVRVRGSWIKRCDVSGQAEVR